MKTFDGYKKRNLTDDNVLLAGGGHKSITDLLNPLGDYLPLSAGSTKRIGGELHLCDDRTPIVWSSGSWWQRIYVQDDSSNNTPVFKFEQSEDTSGKSWTTLFTIYDNKKVEASGFIKIGSSNKKVLLGDGTDKSLDDFSLSGHIHSSIPFQNYTSGSLSSLTSTNATFYYAGGGNTCLDKPTKNLDAYGLMTWRAADGWYGQLLMSSNIDSALYWRVGMSLSGNWRTLIDNINYNIIPKANESINGLLHSNLYNSIIGYSKTVSWSLTNQWISTGDYDHVDYTYNLSPWGWAESDCAPGCIVTIKGLGGTSPTLWAFTDRNGKIISRAPVQTYYGGETKIVAPLGTVKLYINNDWSRHSSPSCTIYWPSLSYVISGTANRFYRTDSNGLASWMTLSYSELDAAYKAGSTSLNFNTNDLYVNGNLYINDRPITWNSGSYWQRLVITDDSSANTPVFTFLLSENSGSSWNTLLTIKDNGNLVVPNTATINSSLYVGNTINYSDAIIYGSVGIERNDYTMIRLKRNNGPYGSMIIFSNTNGDLGGIGMTGEADNGLKRWTADISSVYTIFDSGNFLQEAGLNYMYKYGATITNGYYFIPGVGSQITRESGDSGWRKGKIPVKAGDVFYIKGRGGYDPDLYAWLNLSGIVTTISGDDIAWEGGYHEITAPNDGYLVCNFNNSYSYGIIPKSWIPWILSEANFTNYTVTKTGGGASGTWGINISGKASTASSADSAYTVSSWAQCSGSPDRYIWMSHSDNQGHAGYHPGLVYNTNTSTLKPTNIDASNTINISWDNGTEPSYMIGGNKILRHSNGGLVISAANLPIHFRPGGTDNVTLMYLNTLGELGLGVTSPSCTLDVSGNQRLANYNGGDVSLEFWRASNASWQFLNSSGTLFIRSNYSSYKTSYGASGTAVIYIGYDSGHITTNGSFYAGSDIRYKDIDSYINISVKNISELPIFKFRWKNTNSLLRLGSSAQAVKEILPELVTYDESKDFYNLDYATLGTIAGITACKELVNLKSEIDSLKERIKELEQQLKMYHGNSK